MADSRQPASPDLLFDDDPAPRVADNPEFSPVQTGPAFRDIQGLECRKDRVSVQTNAQDMTPYGNQRPPQNPSRRLSVKRNLDDYR